MAAVCQNSLHKLNRNVDATFKRRTFFSFFFFCPNVHNTLFDLDARRLLSISRMNQKPGLSARDAEHYNHSYPTFFSVMENCSATGKRGGVGLHRTSRWKRGKKKKKTPRKYIVYSAVFPAGEHFYYINQPLTNAERHRRKQEIFFSLTI